MNPELLIAHFNRISNAPDAISRLRQFILELAVRGRLVEQDPSEERASEILRRIRAEKAQLVKQGILKSSTQWHCRKTQIFRFRCQRDGNPQIFRRSASP